MVAKVGSIEALLEADLRTWSGSFRKGAADVSGFQRRVGQDLKRIDGHLTSLNRSAALTGTALKGAFAGLMGVSGAKAIIGLADTWTELKGRVDLAAGSMENGEVVMSRIAEMARRTYSGLEQTAEGWLSNATALTELGYSTSEQLDLVETLNNALVISAAKGDRAASVMNAWSKAMALGKLSGDNLNTIIQSGGRLAEALAASMGVSTNQLRAMGQAGKITTKEMYGVTSQLEKLREEADGMAATIGDAMQLLRDSMLQYVGGADQASQTSARLAEQIIKLADNFGDVADVAVELATVLAGALAGRAVLGMAAALPKASGAVMALITAMRAGTLTAAGFAAALGPIGLVLGGISAALFVFTNRQSDAEFQAEQFTKAINLNAKALETGRDASGKYSQALRDQIAMQVEAARAAYDMADAAFVAAAKTAAAFAVTHGLRRTDLDYDMHVKDKEAGDALALLDKLEAQLKRIDEVGTTKPAKITPPGTGDGKGKSKRENDYEQLSARIAETTAAMVAETEAQRQLNPLIEDYGYTLAKTRSEQDLLTAAKKAGIEVTPQLRDEIAELADQYATAQVEAKKLGDSQDEIRRRAEEMADFQKDVTKDIVTGFMEGRKAADIFADALGRIADKLLDMALNSIFDGFGGGGGGNFLGTLITAEHIQ